MSFSTSISDALFANGSNLGDSENLKKLKNRTAEKSLAWQNDNQPLAEAQKIADVMMAQKQRQPMVFENQSAPGYWEITTMYINPQRLTFQTQKIKSKAITRGGIYFHHHGDDVVQLSLSGNTGLSGMRALEQLEKTYYASGTLLKYQNYGPQKTDVVAGSYGVKDYKDTIGVLDTFVSTQNPTTLGLIQSKYLETNGDKVSTLTKITNYVSKVMDSYKSAVNGQNMIDELDKASTAVNDWASKFKDNNKRDPSPTEYYNNAVSILKNNIKTIVASDMVVTQAYNLTIKHFSEDKISYDDLFKLSYNLSLNGTQYRGFNQPDILTNFVQNTINPPQLSWNQQKDTLEQIMTDQAKIRGSLGDNLINDSVKNANKDNSPDSLAKQIQTQRLAALRDHLNQIADWEQRERTIQDQLRTTVLTTLSDMFDDEWAPRRLILYYENRAYIGHFDSFSYNRVAETPLISYDLKFTVEKQIIGTLL